jgi:uncharacterized protein YwgA
MENLKKKKLISILKLIGIKSISQIKESENPEEDDKSFELRLRIQKIMYFLISEKLDKDLNYSYSVYLRGPYSPDLSKDYFSISDEEFRTTKDVLSEKSPLKSWIKQLNEKDSLWLEIASTLRSFMNAGYNEEKAIERVTEFKEEILNAEKKDHTYVENVLKEIKDLRL